MNENNGKSLPSKTDVIWSQKLPEAVSEGVKLPEAVSEGVKLVEACYMYMHCDDNHVSLHLPPLRFGLKPFAPKSKMLK